MLRITNMPIFVTYCEDIEIENRHLILNDGSCNYADNSFNLGPQGQLRLAINFPFLFVKGFISQGKNHVPLMLN